MARRKVKGERRHGNGWQVYVRIHGELRTAQFPLDSSPTDRETWRIRQKNMAPPPPAPKGSLGRDAVTYLRSIRHRPDHVNQEKYLHRWVDLFGKYTPRAAITPQAVETALSDLLASGLSPITVRHHRTALRHLYRFHDGKLAPTPVDGTTRPRDPAPEPTVVPLEHVRLVLEHLRATKTRARLKVLLTTGIPHKQIGMLKPEDWDKDRALLRVARRSKGRGAAGRYLPLSDAATDALKEFHRADAWGPFSASSMYKRVKEACLALKIPVWTPYALRHLHGTLLYLETGDLTTTARMLGHADVKTAARYAMSAFALVDAQAAAKVGAKLQGELPKAERTPKNE
jgi:integrase